MTISLANANWTIRQWNTMVGRGSIQFDFPIQRKSGMWSEEGKSLLIHSALIGFPIPQVFLISNPLTEEMAKEEKFKQLKVGENVRDIIDGLQRITTFLSYINNEFALIDSTPDVYDVDTGETFEIAGKTFEEQLPEIQARILAYPLKSYTIDGSLASAEEIEGLFLRLNNGVALKNDQKIKSILGLDVAKRLEQFDINEFIVKNAFSANQIKTDAHLSAILSYLLFKSSIEEGQKVTSYSITEIIKFAHKFREKTIEERHKIIDEVLEVFWYGTEVLKDEKKVPFLKRANFAVVTMLLDKAYQQDINPQLFLEWFNGFVAEVSADKENTHPFNEYAGQGTTKHYIISHKYDVMNLSLKRFLKEKEIEFDGFTTVEENQQEQVGQVANS